MKIPITPSLDEFRALARNGNVVPVSAELIADAETPVSAYQKLNDGGHAFLLESAEHIDEGGRYSFVGTNPRMVFQAQGNDITLSENGTRRAWTTDSDPFTELQALMGRFRPVDSPDLPRFWGGAVGYIGYDVVRFFEPTVGAHPPDDLGFPDMVWLVTGAVLIFDHRLRRLRIVVSALIENEEPDAAYTKACEEIAAILERLDAPIQLPPIDVAMDSQGLVLRSNTTREEFLAAVRHCHEFIHAGDIFQVVLSQRFEADYTGDPLTLYRSLRFVNPSPYLYCFQFAGSDGATPFALVGSSPETHVRAIDGKVEIRPIAGTRRRGATPEEDAQNADDLLADPKERAEHLMLVDLARNDVGRVAEFGSVHVSEFMKIERFSHVMHIVSRVVGTLRPECGAFDVMRATFPAGTVSGSPKVRAMQIINGLEKNRRGTYAGAVGYFGWDGNHDSCIALRTVALKQGKAYVQAGAGIVADSTPEGEYEETVNKATGMLRAIAKAAKIPRRE
jgi:anthranilate synthase component 1